jgi:hypothetical protein
MYMNKVSIAYTGVLPKCCHGQMNFDRVIPLQLGKD